MTIVVQEQLFELAGLSTGAHRSTLRRALRKAGIPFKELNGKIFTTEEAITASLVGYAKKSKGPNLDAIAPSG